MSQYVTFPILISYYLITLGLAEYSLRILMNLETAGKYVEAQSAL